MKITFTKPGLPATGVVVVSANVGAGAGSKLSASAVKLDKKSGGALSRAIRASHFEGKSGQSLNVMAPAGTKLDEVMTKWQCAFTISCERRYSIALSRTLRCQSRPTALATSQPHQTVGHNPQSDVRRRVCPRA